MTKFETVKLKLQATALKPKPPNREAKQIMATHEPDELLTIGR